jgi:hypothetical protein
MKVDEEVMTMPSGWMSDARHDTRMRSAFIGETRAKGNVARARAQNWTLHHKTHRVSRPMRGAHA